MNFNARKRVVQSHLPRKQMVENMLRSGLTAQDVLDGVTLSHQEYLALVEVARLGLFEHTKEQSGG